MSQQPQYALSRWWSPLQWPRIGCSASGVATCVTEGPALTVPVGLIMAVAAAGGWGIGAGKGPAWTVSACMVIGGSVGWGAGCYEGLARQRHRQWWEMVADGLLWGVLAMGSLHKRVPGFLADAGLVAAAFVAAFWLGRLWSVRQVDDETRRRLVEPE